MNLEREIELFEEWCDIFGLPTDKIDDEYTDSRTTIAFLAWYQAVNRKGYKFVPVEPTAEMIDAGIRRQWDELSSPMECMHTLIYKAMIGAVDD